MTKEHHKETLGDDGHVHHLGNAGGFMSADICQNTSKDTRGYVAIIVYLPCECLNKAVKKKERR